MTVAKYGLVLSIGEEPNKTFAPPVLDFGNIPTESALARSARGGLQGVPNNEGVLVGGEESDAGRFREGGEEVELNHVIKDPSVPEG